MLMQMDVWSSASEANWKLGVMTEDDLDRPNTCSWQSGWEWKCHVVRRSWEDRVYEQIKGKLRYHAGEVRTWPPCVEDTWVPAGSNDVVEFLRDPSSPTQTSCPANAKQNLYERIFSRRDAFYARSCNPDLENAISTLAVWDKNKAQVCVRAGVRAHALHWHLR